MRDRLRLRLDGERLFLCEGMTTTATADSIGPQTFTYEAQTDDGHRLRGTMEAVDAEQAMARLRAMRLRVTSLNLAGREEKVAGGGKALRGADFIAFNEQVAQLAAAGLPLEQGLRLIAADVSGRRLRATIEKVAAELESGTPLEEAFDKYRGSFPPLYGRLVRAGVKSGDLSAVLLSLGRHQELIQRLRSILWRTVAYPLFVLVGMGILVSFLGIVVLPQYGAIYRDFHIRLPEVTHWLLSFSTIAPALLVTLVLLVLVGPIVWRVLERLGYSTPVVEWCVMPLPLIGPVLRANLVARWCDAARLGVRAGLDLPAAIELANDATRSGRLSADGRRMIEALTLGRPLTAAHTRVLPATIPAAVQYASGYSDLAGTLGSLSEMYQRQAELRMSALPAVLTPALVLILALVIGFVILALMMPFVTLIEGMTSPGVRRR